MKRKIIQSSVMQLVLLLVLVHAVSAQEKYTPLQLKDDYSLFCKSLKEAHPGLYRYTPKSEFDSLMEAIGNKIDHSMDQQQFYMLLLPLISQIKCGHTKLHPDSNWTTRFYYNTEHVFPWKLHFDGNKGYVTGSYVNGYNAPAGSEVLMIQGRPVSKIIAGLLPAFFSDGNNLTFKYIEMDHYFSATYANLFEGPDTFNIVCQVNGEKTIYTMPSVSHSMIESLDKKLNEANAEKPPYNLDIRSDSVAVLTISSFWEQANNLNFRKFLKSSFRKIQDDHIESLIIDVRNNEGGMDRRGALLLSYLLNHDFGYYDKLVMTTRKRFSFASDARLPKFYGLMRILISRDKDGTYRWNHSRNLGIQKPQKDHFNGKVYVLINGASFSVTAEFASVAHYLKRASFIGEETGGGYYGNNSGSFAIVTLPNSRLNVGIPLVAYYTKVSGYPYPDHGVIPDYIVKPSANDIITGQDPVMKFALSLTKQR